ncbi:RNA polymerase sigma factor [Thiolapillus sp.]
MIDLCFPPSLKKQLKGQRNNLYRLAMSWCGDHMLADDLVQECMVKAWQKRQQLKEREKLNAWLYRILYNCWMEYLRRAKPMAELDEVPAEAAGGPDGMLERQQLADRVRQAVARLPVGQREVVTLVDLEELRYAEVADILEIPIGTVMSRLNRARKTLRGELLHLQAPPAIAETVLRRVK